MTDKELRGLSRKELLEMLLQVNTENLELKEKLLKAEAALQDRQIRIDKAGTLAEAAFQLNGMYEAAQAACQQYMDNIENLSRRQEIICARMESESRKKAAAMLEDAGKQKDAMERETEAKCAAMIETAKVKSETYWNEVSERLNRFLEEHAGLQILLKEIELQRKPE